MSDPRDLEKSDLDKQPLGSVASKEVQGDEPDDLDIHDLHVKRAGRLVVDPECVSVPPPPSLAIAMACGAPAVLTHSFPLTGRPASNSATSSRAG